MIKTPSDRNSEGVFAHCNLKEKMKETKYKKIFIQTVKIAFGSSLSIFLASFFDLEFASSAGTITLLTIVTTKWETVKLSLSRLLSFGVSVALAEVLFQIITIQWVAYGVYLFLVVLLCEAMDWKSAISVNALIGTHFLTRKDFSYEFIANEFWLVVIGITIAVILNLFHGNRYYKEKIIRNMRETEETLQMIIGGLAAYLDNRDMQRNIWEEIRALEERIHYFTGMAYDYQNNTFHSHPGYYIEYFEMRMTQCGILHNLHYEMKKIRKMPAQARIVSNFMLYLTDYITEKNIPEKQIKRLDLIFQDMKTQPLPDTREEFESRAILYHILMDLNEFLISKQRFIDHLSDKQLELYWNPQQR